MKDKDFLHFYIFGDDDSKDISKFKLSDLTQRISPQNTCGIHLEDSLHYGKSAGLYYIWKNDSSDYIGFTLDDFFPDADISYVKDRISNGYNIITFDRDNVTFSLREFYRNSYYNHDLNVVIELINRDYSYMSEYIKDELLDKPFYIHPMAIMRKDIYRKFCLWLFDILDKAKVYCGNKTSKLQNDYLEHLTPYLFNIYVGYYGAKYKTYYLPRCIAIKSNPKDYKLPQEGSIVYRASMIIKEGYPESLAELIKEYEASEQLGCDHINSIYMDDEDKVSLKYIKRAYEDYIRQRRYFKQTWLDENPNIESYIEKLRAKDSSYIRNGRITHKPKVLMLKWNSFNGDDYIRGFEKIGFDTDFIQTTDIGYIRGNDKTEHFNSYLDNHTYDLVFSINYFHSMAEACYNHGIPYIGWCYDSPTDLFPTYGLKYNTTNVFLFDSDEAYRYSIINGYKNVHYMPLAVNCERYDSIKISEDEKDKYSCDISFVGNLYENRLNEYLNYFDDYKKAFINGLIDYNTGLYNSYVIKDVIDLGISEWIKDKRFHNAFYKGESTDVRDPVKQDDISELMGRFLVLVNKTVANRERLILISMLGRHFDFKLYSSSSHEVFNKVTECGTVDYYTEMPKVFKSSKINLNNTLKTIKTGIPLRCLDIMGCHGFLLTNYQSDFDEDFKDGENIAIYHTLEEAYDKAEYYLNHEDQRIKVSNNSYDTVRRQYGYEDLIKKILKVSELEYMIV